MRTIINSCKRWLSHTKRYYTAVLSANGVKSAILTLSLVCVCSTVAVTHAASRSVATWKLDNAFYKDMIAEENFICFRADEAPPESGERFHLTMPMTVEDYLDEDLYAGINDGLKLTLEDEYFDDLYQPQTDEEWEEGSEDALEFIENRPPDLPLKG